MITKHASTPWILDLYPCAKDWPIRAEGRVIARVQNQESSPVFQAQANAAFICRAVNNHDALAMALENLLADVLNIGSSSITMRPSVNEARDLIEKLREEQP